MTGLDLLREEMKKRGCNDKQATSKAVAVVLDIISKSGNKFQDIQEAEKRLQDLNVEIRDAEDRLERIRGIRRAEAKEKSDWFAEADAERKRLEEYVEDFKRGLFLCSTEEAADALRTAQFYVNNTNVVTKYDNTAYIVGLASILSGKKVDPDIELRKINVNLPDTGVRL